MNKEVRSDENQKELFDLPPEQRRLEAVRRVSEMSTPMIGRREDSPWPVELRGYKEHAIALLDLVYKNSKPDSVGMTLKGSLKADPELVKKINANGGFLPVRGGQRETTVLNIEEQEGGVYVCKFGHSARGTTIERNPRGGVNINVNNDPNVIADESLFRLYKLTGKPGFVESLGIRAELRGSGAAQASSAAIDPEGYYAILGLNPYALRFLDEKFFGTLVSGMKKEVARKLHPDSGVVASDDEMEYLKKMLKACDILEKSDRRKEYSSWLSMGNGESKQKKTEDWTEL